MQHRPISTLGVVMLALSLAASAVSNGSLRHIGAVIVVDEIDKIGFRALRCVQTFEGAPASLPASGRYAVLLLDTGPRLSQGERGIPDDVRNAIKNLAYAAQRTGRRLIVIHYVHARHLRAYVPGALSNIGGVPKSLKNAEFLRECESSIRDRQRKLGRGLEPDLITPGLYLADGKSVSQYYLLYPKKVIPRGMQERVNALILGGVSAFFRGNDTGPYPIKVFDRGAKAMLPALPRKPALIRVFSAHAARNRNGFDDLVVGGIEPFLKRYQVVGIGYVYGKRTHPRLREAFPDWDFRAIDGAEKAVSLYNLGLVSVLLDADGRVFGAMLILPASGTESERMKAIREGWRKRLDGLFQELVGR